MPHNGYGLTTRGVLPMVVRQIGYYRERQTQHGDRRHHTRYETETIQNGRVVLASNSPTNGGITPRSLGH
jgi:hypothetical protein